MATFVVPFLLLGIGTEGLTFINKLMPKGASVWIALVVLLVCYLLAAYFDVLTAARYLSLKEAGTEPSLGQIGEVARYPGLWAMFWRLSLRYIGWVFTAIFVFLCIYFLYVVATYLAHSGMPAARGTPGHLSHLYIRLFLIACVGILSRYMFVLPLLARERQGGQLVWERSLAATKPYRWSLVMIAMLLAAIGITPNAVLRAATDRALIGHTAEVLWRIGNGIIVACLSAYFCIFRTVLMTQAIPEFDLEPIDGERPHAG